MNKRILIAVIIAAIAVPAGVYAVSPLFINTVIDEPLPTANENQKKAMAEKQAMADHEKAMAEKQAMADHEKAMAEKQAMADHEKAMAEKQAMADHEKAMAEKQAMADHEKAMAEKESIQGNFAGGGGHTVTGMTKIVQLEDGSKVLRLENFKSTNGPDLFVYLSTDTSASDFVSLGALKANNGNQNYNIPEGTDLSKYNTVLIWCKSFSVLFGSSELTK